MQPRPERQICYTCDHFLGLGKGYKMLCEAFAEGIPNDIFMGRNWHTGPVEGDKGMRYTPVSKCITCARSIGRGGDHMMDCEAFPDGIPYDILWGRNPHTSPVEGDNGIRYTPVPTCSTCVHFIGRGGNCTMVCEAFQEGIPDDILVGRNPHTSPVEGDRGIRYSPAPSSAS